MPLWYSDIGGNLLVWFFYPNPLRHNWAGYRHFNFHGYWDILRKLYGAVNLKPYTLDPNNPKKSIEYYYQVRSNAVHRGKAVGNDFNTIKQSLTELLAIFKDVLDDAFTEANYVDTAIKPLGKIKTIIPRGPDQLDSIIDACLAFYPAFFETCPSMPAVKEKLKDAERMDFDLNINVPPEWEQLREEAKPLMNKLAIFRADLVPVET